MVDTSAGTRNDSTALNLSHQACRQGRSARYWRVPRLFEEIRTMHGDGSYLNLLKQSEGCGVW